MQVSRDLNILNEDLIKQKFRIDAQKWKLWGLEYKQFNHFHKYAFLQLYTFVRWNFFYY